MHKRHIVKVLLFPVLGPIFLIGCALSIIGESKTQNKSRKKPALKAIFPEANDLKMGLIQELNEEPVTSKST